MNLSIVSSGRSLLVSKTLQLLVYGCILLLVLSGCQTVGKTPVRAETDTSVVEAKEAAVVNNRVLENLGIEVIAIRTTAAGSMLDFRFKVLDKDKAMPFFLKELKPHLIDENTGAALEVPVPAKGGPMRPTSRDPRVGITYFMLFGNPGNFVKKGNPVTIVVGENRVENLVVE
ncbi:MAG: hypothetical protein IH613_13595 [Desulfuromonadales bacterium]|nr:hypothetical protein [Desulfuromonadales bacterium]